MPLPTLPLRGWGLALAFGGLVLLLGAGPPADDIAPLLRARLEAARPHAEGPLLLHGAPVRTRALLIRHYRQTGYTPGWVGPQGPTPLVDSLRAVLRTADADGLRPADYHIEVIDSLRHALDRQAAAGAVDERALGDLELLCTDAFLLFGSHLLGGRLDPEALVPSWTLDRRRSDLPDRLRHALDTGAIRATLHALRPPQPGYAALRRTLARHRALAARGGWPVLPDGPALAEGARDARVPLLRRRLQQAGDDPGPPPADALRFDDALRQAVGRFQERHGLAADGVVGPATRAALNVPVEARLRQLLVNLERWRWLPQDLGDRHVIVNIADFWLRVVEQQTTILQMRVVVGTPYRQTPIFSDRISYLVFNPYWHVPRRIAVEDKLPAFQRNPALVSRLGFEVLPADGTTPVDPATVAWDELSADRFPYRLRQTPGPLNALGRVKFMFPNRHTVYLHDTPSRSLFDRSARDFSSGCIRVEYPAELAEALLRANAGWSAERIRATMDGNAERVVGLGRPVPVHLLYWTAWVEDGRPHFRADLYDRDAPVAAALAAPAPRQAGPTPR